jgi:hypothetical protein
MLEEFETQPQKDVQQLHRRYKPTFDVARFISYLTYNCNFTCNASVMQEYFLRRGTRGITHAALATTPQKTSNATTLLTTTYYHNNDDETTD